MTSLDREATGSILVFTSYVYRGQSDGNLRRAYMIITRRTNKVADVLAAEILLTTSGHISRQYEGVIGSLDVCSHIRHSNVVNEVQLSR